MDDRIGQLAHRLASAGVRSAFGVTGSGSSLALISELEQCGVRYYPTAHEASAAIMAGAVTRASGQRSVGVSIKGPGLVNMLPGIAHNHFECVPALTVCEAYGQEVSLSRRHKRLNHAALLQALVKAHCGLDAAVEKFDRLVRIADAESPGPVHVDLCDTGEWANDDCRNLDVRATPSAADFARAMRNLQASTRPAVIVGSAAQRLGLGDRLSQLQAPILTTAAARGVIDESSPASAGILTGEESDSSATLRLLRAADFVLGIGLRNTEVIAPRSLPGPALLMDVASAEFADGFGAKHAIGHVDRPLMVEALAVAADRPWGIDEVQRGRDELRARLVGGKWLPAACFDCLDRLEYLYTAVLDTGAFCTIGERVWRSSPRRPCLTSANGRYMGTAIATACGAAIGRPGEPVFCVVGDGGMSAVAEIKLAVHEKLPICFVLMSDGRFGSVAGAAPAVSSRAVEIARPSWHAAVAAIGCDAERTETITEFADAVRAWGRTGPCFIECAFDPALYDGMTEALL